MSVHDIALKSDQPISHAITDISGRFISVDDSFCTLLHRERREILSHTVLSLTAEEYRPLNADKLNMLRHSGTPFVIRKTYLRPDGGIQPVENTVSLLHSTTGSSVLAASVSPLQAVVDPALVASIGVARLLIRDRRNRVQSGLTWLDRDLVLLLAAYVLETEGCPIWATNLADIVGGDARVNLLRIWELVGSGVLVVDGRATTLEKASIRLAKEHGLLIEHHLANLSGDKSTS